LDIIQETHSYAAAFKPNSAFFEGTVIIWNRIYFAKYSSSVKYFSPAFGPEGFSALQRIILAIPNEIPVILDSKRGDIDTTAQVRMTRFYSALFSASVLCLGICNCSLRCFQRLGSNSKPLYGMGFCATFYQWEV